MSLIITVKNYRKLRQYRRTTDKRGFSASRRSRLVVVLLALAINGLFWHTAKAGTPPSHSSKVSTGNSTFSTTQSRPVWDGKTLLFHNSEGTLALTVVSDDVIRIHFTKADSFVRNDTYAVIGQASSEADPKVEIGHDLTTLETSKLKVSIRQNPLRISFADDAGNTLDEDDAERGMTFDDSGFSVSKRLGEDEHVYGFGEKNGRLDKRGWNLGGYNYVMWNTDTYMHDSATDPMYVSVPFFMVMNQGKAHGIFLDNTWRSFFDVGHDHPGLLTFGAAGGDMDYYFINGPDPKDVIERYTALTGRMPLPPLWSLGYNQCRYSYYPESRVRQLADTFRQKEIPADVIWLDIDYQDNYKPFTWDYERFPDPKKMLSDLRAQHFHVVCIVDPHPKKEKGYPPYDEGKKNNYFVKNPDGTVYQGPVWPSHAKQSPGPSVFPDFSNPAARQWWGQLYSGLEDDGIAGIWNDMDEPSVFDTPSGTMPLNVVFNNDGHPATGYEMHNIYGQQMSRATFEGLSELRPNERAFVLTRSSFAGGQRYAALWTGDSTSDWSSLRQSIATLLGLGLSGFPFVGSDIGGFVGSPSGELYTRWLQVGLFCPFMRSHSDSSSPSKEPWVFGDSNEAINKSTIELRYQLLPYIYNVMAQASETGVPALRPLFLEFPQDEHAATIDDEFLFGPDLLVAPVLYEGVTQRAVYLPEGDWYNYWTGESLKGGQTIQLPVTLKSIPMFVRAGGFIFNQPVVQSTDQMPGNALKVLIAPAKNSASWLYEDDGETLDYRNGNFMKRQFSQVRDKKQTIIKVSGPDGSYRPTQREFVLELWADHEPKNVTLKTEGQASKEAVLPRLIGNDVADASSGWSFDNGVLTIKTQDTFAPMEFVVDGISRP